MQPTPPLRGFAADLIVSERQMRISKEEALGQACRLAENYYKNDKSPVQLLKESGYEFYKDEIADHEIEIYTQNNPNIIEKWIEYSQDKRSSGWYFKRDLDRSVFEVGHPSLGIEKKDYINRAEACARYIRLELESISNNRRR